MLYHLTRIHLSFTYLHTKVSVWIAPWCEQLNVSVSSPELSDKWEHFLCI